MGAGSAMRAILGRGGKGGKGSNITDSSGYWEIFQSAADRTFNRLQKSTRFQQRIAKMSDKQLNKVGNNWSYGTSRYHDTMTSPKVDGNRNGVLRHYQNEAARRGISTSQWGNKYMGNNPIKQIGSVNYGS